MNEEKTKRVAIACQGGGSHTAFTAGVLKHILLKLEQTHAFEIVGLSGNSGGAICAFLAWHGLLKNDMKHSINLLEQFWTRIAVGSYWEMVANAAFVMGQRQVLHVDLNPYLLPEWGREALETLLRDLVDFEKIPGLIQANSPELQISAVDVLSGNFHIFRNREITVEALLASAAVPSIFRSVLVEGSFYWDGLFSQNPPVKDLTKVKPDEIWVIQVNPPTRKTVPQTLEEIRDRRNELAGNLSLEQELSFIAKINDFVEGKIFGNGEYKKILVRKVIMARDLPYESKLDRNPVFLNDLRAYGESQARQLFRIPDRHEIGVD